MCILARERGLGAWKFVDIAFLGSVLLGVDLDHRAYLLPK